MAVFIGPYEFPTQAAAKDHASAVLKAAVLATPLRDGAEDFVHALFTCHPDASVKAGSGVRHFEVRPGPSWSTRNFWVVCTDGTFDNFSIKRCVANAQLIRQRDVNLGPFEPSASSGSNRDVHTANSMIQEIGAE